MNDTELMYGLFGVQPFSIFIRNIPVTFESSRQMRNACTEHLTHFKPSERNQITENDILVVKLRQCTALEKEFITTRDGCQNV